MQRRQFLTAAVGLAAWAAAEAAPAAGASPRAEDDVRAARAWNASRRHQATRFGDIAYVERGTGPVALFLHGFPLNGFQWRGAFDRLSGQRRCIAPDSMGLGFTRVAAGQGVTPSDQADMLAAFLDKLGIASVDLVANDSGGAVAQIFVTRFPDRVRTLLLTNCDVEPDSPPPALQPVLALAREGTYPDQWLVPWFKDSMLARSPQGFGGMCFSDPSQPTDAAVAMYFGPLVATPASKALVNAYALGLDPNPLAGIEAALRRCRVPTRIVWGMADDIFAKESPDYLDRVLPNSRGVRRLPRAKLFWPEEYPDVVADEARTLWGV
ncbi:pimeloyl-ACP methyl ester carboxylesterase [Caulobacter rhizosphaerae]|jgi:pimeloyl-ACP methyl ester carboxylesterase|uniref:Pimeloyl-ACP methyl ester carboxylesterase n=1 Tax=Caulobacter rhizosphaerae TaxID=2010972 RepID=A0ABU1MXJ0_9CAUL|nr:alpha/beta hydrolase [Caulobacter rhizosphaerae]MDR6530889.1 pimeloyl-ACP methyl ester carboxylesterase [Caulobacter rhizosphaerae]